MEAGFHRDRQRCRGSLELQGYGGVNRLEMATGLGRIVGAGIGYR